MGIFIFEIYCHLNVGANFDSSKEASSENVVGQFLTRFMFASLPHLYLWDCHWRELALGNWADELEDMPVARKSPW